MLVLGLFSIPAFAKFGMRETTTAFTSNSHLTKVLKIYGHGNMRQCNSGQ